MSKYDTYASHTVPYPLGKGDFSTVLSQVQTEAPDIPDTKIIPEQRIRYHNFQVYVLAIYGLNKLLIQQISHEILYRVGLVHTKALNFAGRAAFLSNSA